MESLITDTSTSAHPVIGVFPSNWGSSRFGREFEPSSERNGDSPIGPMLSVSEYRGVEVRTNFRDGQLPSEDVSHYRVVRPGQLVANLMWLDHGGLGVSHFPGYVSPAYLAFNISERVDPAFAHHVLRSSVYVDSYKRLGRGVRPNSQMVDSVDLRQLPFPLPPLETQRRIADYLDRETAEIDAAVADLDRYVELLGKRRQVTIADAVTGRIGAASTRDSGIYWMGRVATDWDVVPAWRVMTERKEKSQPEDAHLTPSQTYGVVTQQEYMAITGNKVVLNLTGADSMKRVRPGDFIIHLRSFQGGIEASAVGGKVSNAYTVLIPSFDAYFDFFRWFMKSQPFIEGLASSTDQLRDGQSINYSRFSRLSLPLPSLDTQRKIAAYLDHETAEIDTLMEESIKLRNLLLKRRSVLITEVVTGRKQV